MPWDPQRYERFTEEREAPFVDLLRLIELRRGLTAIDLGCGTGRLTARLAEALPDSQVLGVDSSREMLRSAAQIQVPGLTFREQAIETVQGRWDLVFSHAALQWLPDHLQLIPRLLQLVAPGGQFAVQIPSNHGHLSHRLILQVANEAPFRNALGGWQRISPVLPIDTYAVLLQRSGASHMTVFEKVYPHILEDPDHIVEWVRGTALVPYCERLEEPVREAFVDRYRELVRQNFPAGKVFYPFRRTLFAATVQ
jgi:trans-aconitate 2-methyltransferase